MLSIITINVVLLLSEANPCVSTSIHIFVKAMIPRKRLQLLLYLVHILYAFAAKNDLQQAEKKTISLLDYYNFEFSSDEPNNDISVEYRENELPICNFPELEDTELEDVKNLRIDSVGIEWVSLSWDYSPCNNKKNVNVNVNVNGNADDNDYDKTNMPFSYSVRRCTPGEEECVETNENNASRQHNATNLNPCTRYDFIVKVIDGDRQSKGVNASTTTSRNITKIGEIRKLTVENVTASSVRLIWEPPSIYEMCVHNYSISIECFERNCKTTKVTATATAKEYVAENLQACNEYYFTVVAVTETVRSNLVGISKKTSSLKPSKPLLRKVESERFSLRIFWEPPKLGESCVKHYRVTISNNRESITENSTGRNLRINGVKSCTTYNVYINAVDQANNDGEMETYTTNTSAVASESPRLNADSNPPIVSSTAIRLTWIIQREKNNNCPLLLLKTVCNYTVSEGHGYENVNGEAETRIESSNAVNQRAYVVNSTVEKVSPFTTYTCWAYAVNEAGPGEISKPINATTLEDLPSAPLLDIAKISDSKFLLNWEAPEYLAGTLETFEIEIGEEILFPVPDWCIRESSPIVSLLFNGSVFSHEYVKTKPYTNYLGRIRAKTRVGWGNYSKTIKIQTEPGVPGMVSNLSYLITKNENDENSLKTILQWALPCSSNGLIEYFYVTVNGTRDNYQPHFFSIEKRIDGYAKKRDLFSINFDELNGEYNYTFKVFAKVCRVDDFGVPATYANVLYPAGIPPEPEQEYIKSITIDPYRARRSTSSAAILLPLFQNTNGDVVYYSIIVAEIGHNYQSRARFNLKNDQWPNVSSWEESMHKDFTIPYQATRPYWDPSSYVADYGHMKAVKYELGEDSTCKEISSNTKKRLYCNGPLKPDTWYHVRMRAFTHGGYADSSLFLIKTNAELNVGIVIGIVLGILFLGILTTMMLLVPKCSPYVVLRRLLDSDMSGSPVPAPFTRKKFIVHCQQLVDNPGKLSNEFRLLQTLSVDLQMPTNSACLQANRKKNRYSDILPYDFSRVKLEVIDNDPNTDYINASLIRGYTGEDEYIACQGPKEETTYDFWRMVDQYDVNLVIMLTRLIEKGKEKCHQYFPTIRETFSYENMSIRCTSELDFRTYTQRTLMLQLQKGNKRRNITHLHFKDWPDHDVPEDFDPMIHFSQIMRRNIQDNKGLVVIHCSAGIGRTGTLIAIDILLQHLRDNRKLDVFGTVYRLRHNRINMVQRESQYAYIYNCTKQVLKNPYCLKTYKPPPVDPVFENQNCRKLQVTNTNSANNFETLTKRNFFMSMDSIGLFYDVFSWSGTSRRVNRMKNEGLRYCKSTGALNKDVHPCSPESDSLNCLIYKVLENSTNESNVNDDTLKSPKSFLCKV